MVWTVVRRRMTRLEDLLRFMIYYLVVILKQQRPIVERMRLPCRDKMWSAALSGLRQVMHGDIQPSQRIQVFRFWGPGRRRLFSQAVVDS